MVDEEYFNINNDLFENDIANNAFESIIDESAACVDSFENDNETGGIVEEGRALAIASGLGGIYTFAPYSSEYDLEKEKSARRALAQLRGDPVAQYEADNTGSQMLHRIGSVIPIVGAIVNNNAYQRRIDAENELRAEIEKRGLRK